MWEVADEITSSSYAGVRVPWYGTADQQSGISNAGGEANGESFRSVLAGTLDSHFADGNRPQRCSFAALEAEHRPR